MWYLFVGKSDFFNLYVPGLKSTHYCDDQGENEKGVKGWFRIDLEQGFFGQEKT